MASSNLIQQMTHYRLVAYTLPGTFLVTSILCKQAKSTTCGSLTSEFISGHLQTAIFHPRLLFTDFARYKEKAFARLWAIGGLICAQDTPAPLPPILATSKGVILDVGPGAGHQVFRFSNVEGVQAIYGAEPGESMHAALKNRAMQAGLGDKYHVLSCGAELNSLVPALAKAGVLKPQQTQGSNTPFDEIVCLRVLCGVPEPDAVIAGLYSLLKPGGRMVVCEHLINSGDTAKGGTPVGRLIQQACMWMAWSPLMGGCDLTRDTLASLYKAAEKDGGWAKVDVNLCDPYSTIPHIVGTLAKRQ